jgi:hypothetical protein
MRNHQLIILILAALPLAAQTKVLLRNTVSPLGIVARAGGGTGCTRGVNDFRFLVANTTQGSGTPSAVFAPTNGTPPCLQQDANGDGNYMVWVTAPLSSAVTISSNINYSVGCAESAIQLNLGYRFVLYRWSRLTGGIVSTIHTSAATTECGTTLALRTIAAAAPTSTSMQIGDRIVIEIEALAVGGGWGGNSARTATVGYDGAAAGTRDTFVNFVNTLAFGTDTANGRAVIAGLFDYIKESLTRGL